MSESSAMLLAIKGHIFDLPKADQNEILKIKEKLIKLVGDLDSNGHIAITLVMTEMAVQQEG